MNFDKNSKRKQNLNKVKNVIDGSHLLNIHFESKPEGIKEFTSTNLRIIKYRKQSISKSIFFQSK